MAWTSRMYPGYSPRARRSARSHWTRYVLLVEARTLGYEVSDSPHAIVLVERILRRVAVGLPAGIAAGELELTHEFGATLDLDDADGKGHAGDQVGEAVASGAGGGTTADGEDGDAAGDIDGGELAAFEAGAGAHGVELDESTERGDGIVGIRMA